MKKVFMYVIYALAMSCSAMAFAGSPIKLTTRHDDSVVKQLEASYAQYAAAARKGDLAGFRAMRTAEFNRAIPPDATADQLKGMADFLAPALTGAQFVQLETKGDQARMTYKRRTQDSLTFEVIFFKKVSGNWKVGGGHTHELAGRAANEADGLKKALASPDIRFAEK